MSADDVVKEPKQKMAETEKPVEKELQDRGEGDFRAASLKLQAEVDKAVAEKKWSTKELAKSDQQVKRSENRGTIDWWQRSVVLTVDAGATVEQARRQIENSLKGKKGTVLRQEKDTYDGKAVERLDVALLESLGGETVRLVTDKIYIVGAAAARVKKTGNGRLAILVDDCGYDTDTVSRMTALRQKITFAVLPDRAFTAQALSIIKSAGKQAMLHLPMEPLNASQQSENNTVMVNMSDSEIKQLTARFIAQMPGIEGVNNHQGSRATADERVMRAVLSVVKDNGLFFVDSNTQPKTVAHKVAASMGVRTALNGAFLDGEADVEYIKKRLRQAGQTAIENGSHIAICHARPKTVIALTEMVDELEEMGVQFVFVSSLLR